MLPGTANPFSLRVAICAALTISLLAPVRAEASAASPLDTDSGA
jgi:hypothetical protein